MFKPKEPAAIFLFCKIYQIGGTSANPPLVLLSESASSAKSLATLLASIQSNYSSMHYSQKCQGKGVDHSQPNQKIEKAMPAPLACPALPGLWRGCLTAYL
ncbi:hypothetical protein QQP08_019775 [Theobroma cacao]|nr:hypothetical protein QQP08_019775 [Theobroma cacao]